MPSRPTLEFLLVPDGGAARRVRRALTTGGARSGVMVGTWSELLNRARENYCVPEPRSSTGTLEKAIEEMEDAFWHNSLTVAPDETSATVRTALHDLISACGPDRELDPTAGERFSERTRKLVSDLARLARTMGSDLPGDLPAIRDLLDASDAPCPIRIHRIAGIPWTTRWQDALIAKLNRDAARAGNATDPEWSRTLRACLKSSPTARPGTALHALQTQLFERDGGSVFRDSTAQWIRVRDFYQESEIVAGMVQTLLDGDPDLRPSDIGLIVPGKFEYGVALEDAFRLAAVPLSGLAVERWERDLGGEAVFHFLFCRQKPAPAMAQASLVSSVLMPWSAEDGERMAKRVMDGRYGLKVPDDADRRAKSMIRLIEGADSEPASLVQALREFVELLGGGDRFAHHRGRAAEAVGLACSELESAKELDWWSVRREVGVDYLRGAGAGRSYNREGVAVWNEDNEPWRTVRHLFVLGFEQGRYPARPSNSPVFSDDEIRSVREELNLDLELPAELEDRRRGLLKRQLRAASDSVTFMIPHRSPSGGVQAPSDSLVFMRRLVSDPGRGGEIVKDLDSADDQTLIHHLALAISSEPVPPRPVQSSHLDLGRNLLMDDSSRSGHERRESPSSLEMALVSPLALPCSHMSRQQ